MAIILFQLNKSQRLLANGAAKNYSRPVLSSICVKKNESGQGVAVVTDGYSLVEKQVDYDGSDTILLDAKDVAACKDDKQLGTVTFIPSGDNTMQAIVANGSRNINLVSGSFPSYGKLFPTGEPVLRIDLGKDVLLKMLKCLDEKNGENNITFYLREPGSPVEFHVGNSVRGLIMPLRISDVADEQGASSVAVNEKVVT